MIFSPEDLTLVKGDPSDRRRFLDDLLVLRAPRLAGVRADYDRVLKQRNSLLKTAGAARRGSSSQDGALATLSVWDEHLARTGAELLAERLRLVDELRPYVGKAYETVARGASRDDADIGYKPSFELSRDADAGALPERTTLAELLLAELERRRKDELDRGVSLVGPHRDELVLTLGSGDRPAAGEGLRLPRRVLVVRARAQAGVVRPAARRRRRPDPDPRRRLRRARHRSPRASWPSWSPAPSRCWSPRRWPPTSRRRWPGPATWWRTGRCAVTSEQDPPDDEPTDDRTEGRRTTGQRRLLDRPDHDDTGLDLARTLAKVDRRRGPHGAAQEAAQARTAGRSRASAGSGAHPDDRDPQTPRHHPRPAGRRPGLGDRPQGAQRLRPLGRRSSATRSRSTAQPTSFADGKLVVRTDSTAWATQLRLLAPTLVRRLNEELGHGSVTLIEVEGPNLPTWKKGRLSSRDGRGPRDTYG